MEERKSFIRYSFIFKAVAVMLIMALVANFTLSAKAEEAQKKYVREIIIVTADTLKQAKEKADAASKATYDDSNPGKRRDYIVFETPIYEGTVNGVATKTWLCYATTNNRNLAVTSIKAMNMRGGWSYEEYDKFLAEAWDKAGILVNDMIVAVREYNVNLEAETPGAVYAAELLDLLYEDDTEQTVASFFKGMGKAPYTDKTKEDDCIKKMTTFVMESNVNILCSIENALMLACADTYTKEKLGYGANLFEGLEEPIFLNTISDEVDYPEFDNYADDIINSLPQMQEALFFYMSDDAVQYTLEMEEVAGLLEDYVVMTAKENGMSDEDIIDKREEYFLDLLDDVAEGRSDFDLTDEQIETADEIRKYNKYFDNLTIDKQELYSTGRMLYAAFSNCNYLGYKYPNGERQYDTLLDLMTYYDLSDKLAPKENYLRKDFYPIISLMSPGQRSMLKVGFTQLVSSVVTGVEILRLSKSVALAAINDKLEDGEEPIKEGDIVSVYSCVDRSLYEPDSGIALTKDAVQKTKEIPLSPEQAELEKAEKIANWVMIASGATAAILTGTMIGMVMYMQSVFSAATAMTTQICFGVMADITAVAVQAGTASMQLLKSTITKEVVVRIGQQVGTSYSGTFFQGLRAFMFSGAIGTVLTILNVLAIAGFLIALIIKFKERKKAEKADTPYIDIPRVMCSYEPLFSETADGGKSDEEDYIFYYGAKNPGLTKADQDRAANVGDVDGNKTDILNHGIGDVANWSLKGPKREWIALYAANDLRAGNPILAGKFMVTSDWNKIGKAGSDGEGYVALKKFGEGAAYDMQNFCSATLEDSSVGERYIGYMMESSYASQGASVFSNITPFGMLVIGAVTGGGLGALCTYFINRKRKKNKVAEG